MLTGIRNGIAISIFILSTYFIHQRKIIPFLILIFIAYWFHNSVILYAPLAYIIANGKTVTKKTIFTWLTIMIIIALAANTFLLSFVETFVNRYFNRYSLPLENVKELGINAGMLASLFALATSALLLFLVKDKNLSQKEI
jgi:diacylglycerol kinase